MAKKILLYKVSRPLVLHKLSGRKTLFKGKIKQPFGNFKTKMAQQHGIYKTLLIKTLILSLGTSIFHGTPELLHSKQQGKWTCNLQMDGCKISNRASGLFFYNLGKLISLIKHVNGKENLLYKV